MPQVGFYESPEVNAFATGPTKSRSLVAVSTGLLRGMSRQEVEGVLAHEISHVANGDMVTMTLIQGVVNAFVLYLSHIVAAVVRNTVARDDERGPSLLGMLASQLVFIAAQIVFGLLGSMITAWFSRQREFRADAGGASLAGRGAMIGALRRLQGFQGRVDNSHSPELATLKIAGGSRFLALLSTHPPLELRIRTLEMS
jgi:heat shock protein HtpX